MEFVVLNPVHAKIWAGFKKKMNETAKCKAHMIS